MLTRCSTLVLISTLSFVSACSFHSSQWEGAKAIWDLAFPEQLEERAYWWDMQYLGNSHRLFPLDWQGQSVLTDGRRWIMVLKDGEFRMLRDLELGQDLRVAEIGEESFGLSGEEALPESRLTDIYLEDSRILEKLSITLSPAGSDQHTEAWQFDCLPTGFHLALRRFEKVCFVNNEKAQFSMSRLDESGSLTHLDVMIGTVRNVKLIRSSAIADLSSIRSFLSVDE